MVFSFPANLDWYYFEHCEHWVYSSAVFRDTTIIMVNLNVVHLIMIFGTPFNVAGMPFNVSPYQQNEALCIV